MAPFETPRPPAAARPQRGWLELIAILLVVALASAGLITALQSTPVAAPHAGPSSRSASTRPSSTASVIPVPLSDAQIAAAVDPALVDVTVAIRIPGEPTTAAAGTGM